MIGAAGLSPCCTPAGRAPGLSRKGCASWAEDYGVQAATLVAVLGPGIGPCCYAVDAGRAELFERQFGGPAVRDAAGGRAYLDLRAANAALLEAAGVREVHAAAECTACTGELFSFRRDGPGFGRMAAFIGASRAMNRYKELWRRILAETLSARTGRKVEESEIVTEVPPRPELGDLAFPLFPFAKSLRKSPKEVALELAAALRERRRGGPRAWPKPPDPT